MSPEEALEEVRAAAGQHGAGELATDDLWYRFHGVTYDLCRDEPLHGRLLDLFELLEEWEATVMPDRGPVEQRVRAVAQQLAELGP
jgi:hypothetical protein